MQKMNGNAKILHISIKSTSKVTSLKKNFDMVLQDLNPPSIYLLKVNKRNTRNRFKVNSGNTRKFSKLQPFGIYCAVGYPNGFRC